MPNAKLELTVLKDETEMPPNNTQYKPQCIDSATVFQVKDDQNQQINIYWWIPPKSFGSVSYRIVPNNAQTLSILSLPYSVPYSQIDLGLRTFQVITVTEFEESIYESNVSDPITIKHDSVANKHDKTTLNGTSDTANDVANDGGPNECDTDDDVYITPNNYSDQEDDDVISSIKPRIKHEPIDRLEATICDINSCESVDVVQRILSFCDTIIEEEDVPDLLEEYFHQSPDIISHYHHILRHHNDD
eukprot:809268_1